MKALLFTLDAVFSLTIAAVSISVLLYFTYLSQVPYPIHYSNLQSILLELTSSTVDSIQNTSTLAKAIVAQFIGANETSPQFLGGPQGNSSNFIGPLEPLLDYVYTPGNAMTTSVVADYGNIYFAANTLLYAVNATTNMTVWIKNVVTNIVSTPALYSGLLYYANSTNLTAVSAKTGNILWSTNSIRTITPITSPISVYDNEVMLGGSDSNMHAYYAYNGTTVWTAATTGNPGTVAILKGNVAVRTSSNAIAVIVQTGNTANLLVGTSYSAPNGPTNLAAAGTKIYLGTGSSANAIYTNGIVVGGFPVSTSSGMTGVSVYKNYVVYQNANAVVALSPSGASYWNVAAPASFGTALSNSTPVVTSSMVYTLWSNGLAGQNLTTGAFQWFALIPKVKIFPYMTLAYGRIYVVANNRVFAYGSCGVPMHASLLSAAATLYFNQQPGCGSALLNSAYPMVNYTIFVANATSRTIAAASFSGSSSYISAKNSAQLNTSYVSVSFWMNISSLPPNGVRLVNYGDNGTCLAPNTYCGWFFYLISNGMVQFNVMNGNQFGVNGIILSTKKWYNIVGVYNGSSLSLFVNGGAPYKTAKPGVIGLTSANINLTIGGGLSTDNRYFTGNMANLQIYNKQLSMQQASQLYLRGVQGVPIKTTGLVAWYPLAGDTNDYSMFNTGFSTGTKFVTKNYVSPALSGAYDISKSSTMLPLLNYTNGATNTILVGVYSWS